MKRTGSIFYKVITVGTRKSIVMGNDIYFERLAITYPPAGETVEAIKGSVGILVFETLEDARHSINKYGWNNKSLIVKVKALTKPTSLKGKPQWDLLTICRLLEQGKPLKEILDESNEFPWGTWGVQKVLLLA